MNFDAKPKSPNLDKLNDAVDQMESDLNNAVANKDGEIMIGTHEALFIRDALVFTLNSLGNRKVYQKRQQIIKKEIAKIAKRMLGKDEIDRISQLANEQAKRTALPDAVVNGDDDNDNQQ